MGLREVSSGYTVSLHYDRRLYRQDIDGSIAHARMLAKQGIIDSGDAQAIVDGLGRVRQEIEGDEFPWRPELEDLHMNIERRLHELIGEPALRLHTARSRNDQVALDMRMYVKDTIADTLSALHRLRRTLVSVAEGHEQVVMPGYTHGVHAQPTTLGAQLLSWVAGLERDFERFEAAYKHTN